MNERDWFQQDLYKNRAFIKYQMALTMFEFSQDEGSTVQELKAAEHALNMVYQKLTGSSEDVFVHKSDNVPALDEDTVRAALKTSLAEKAPF